MISGVMVGVRSRVHAGEGGCSNRVLAAAWTKCNVFSKVSLMQSELKRSGYPLIRSASVSLGDDPLSTSRQPLFRHQGVSPHTADCCGILAHSSTSLGALCEQNASAF